jgi:hypothetical protein
MTKDEALMQMLNEINAGLKTALTRVNELVAENKALKEALALTSTQCEKQPAQEPDELTIAYMSGLYDGKKKRPWVGLTEDEVFRLFGSFTTMTGKGWLDLYRMSEAKLKEKNFD